MSKLRCRLFVVLCSMLRSFRPEGPTQLLTVWKTRFMRVAQKTWIQKLLINSVVFSTETATGQGRPHIQNREETYWKWVMNNLSLTSFTRKRADASRQLQLSNGRDMSGSFFESFLYYTNWITVNPERHESLLRNSYTIQAGINWLFTSPAQYILSTCPTLSTHTKRFVRNPVNLSFIS